MNSIAGRGAWVLGLVLMAGCAGSEPLAAPPSTLADARALWALRAPDGYQVTVQQSCFCLPEFRQPLRVTVENGRVSSVRGLEQPLHHSGSLDQSRLTVAGLFDVIERAGRTAAELRVVYDAGYGFPTELFIDGDRRIADDEFTYRLSDFRAD